MVPLVVEQERGRRRVGALGSHDDAMWVPEGCSRSVVEHRVRHLLVPEASQMTGTAAMPGGRRSPRTDSSAACRPRARARDGLISHFLAVGSDKSGTETVTSAMLAERRCCVADLRPTARTAHAAGCTSAPAWPIQKGGASCGSLFGSSPWHCADERLARVWLSGESRFALGEARCHPGRVDGGNGDSRGPSTGCGVPRVGTRGDCGFSGGRKGGSLGFPRMSGDNLYMCRASAVRLYVAGRCGVLARMSAGAMLVTNAVR
jgi:hypothetical protein